MYPPYAGSGVLFYMYYFPFPWDGAEGDESSHFSLEGGLLLRAVKKDNAERVLRLDWMV